MDGIMFCKKLVFSVKIEMLSKSQWNINYLIYKYYFELFMIKLPPKKAIEKVFNSKRFHRHRNSEIKQTKLEQINNDQSIPSTLIEEVSSLNNINTYMFIIQAE